MEQIKKIEAEIDELKAKMGELRKYKLFSLGVKSEYSEYSDDVKDEINNLEEKIETRKKIIKEIVEHFKDRQFVVQQERELSAHIVNQSTIPIKPRSK